MSCRGFPRVWAGYLGGSRSPVATALCSSEGARFGPTAQGARFGWWVLPPGENNCARCAVIAAQVRGLWVFPV